MKENQEDRFLDQPLSNTSVSWKLALIQKRCAELLEAPDDELALSLEEPAEPAGVLGSYFIAR